jgi:hypothetical protein
LLAAPMVTREAWRVAWGPAFAEMTSRVGFALSDGADQAEIV